MIEFGEKLFIAGWYFIGTGTMFIVSSCFIVLVGELFK